MFPFWGFPFFFACSFILLFFHLLFICFRFALFLFSFSLLLFTFLQFCFFFIFSIFIFGLFGFFFSTPAHNFSTYFSTKKVFHILLKHIFSFQHHSFFTLFFFCKLTPIGTLFYYFFILFLQKSAFLSRFS